MHHPRVKNFNKYGYSLMGILGSFAEKKTDAQSLFSV